MDCGQSGLGTDACVDLATMSKRLNPMTPVSARWEDIPLDNDNDDDDDMGVLDESVAALEPNVAAEVPYNSTEGVEMNSNTNGKVLNSNFHDNMNDNRHHMAVPFLKKIKQIHMEETPLQLSGLSLSGSGMDLFVRIDDKLEKAFRLNSTPASKPGKFRKRTTKSKNMKRNRDKILGTPISKGMGVDGPQQGITVKPPEEGEKTHTEEKRKEPSNGKSETNEPIEVPKSTTAIDAVTPQMSKISDSASVQLTEVSACRQVYCNSYGYNQNFQPASSLSKQQRSVINGPTWNVENGRIDVIKSQDKVSSITSSRPTTVNTCEVPIDYSFNPRPNGFKSIGLPVQRHSSPPRWGTRDSILCPSHFQRDSKLTKTQRRRIFTPTPSPDFSSDIEEADDDYRSFCDGPDLNSRGHQIGKKIIRKNRKPPKRRKKKETTEEGSSSKEKTATSSFQQPQIPRQEVSDISHAESSIGPRFDTESLASQSTIDAETLLKFTEYTHSLRKDLKQKYKDLSRLVKTFEEAVTQRNENEIVQPEETDERSRKCTVM